MSSLVILAASVFEILCGQKQKDTQTNGGRNPIPPRMPSARIIKSTNGGIDQSSLAALWRVTLSIPTGQTDRRTDARPLHDAFRYGRCQLQMEDSNWLINQRGQPVLKVLNDFCNLFRFLRLDGFEFSGQRLFCGRHLLIDLLQTLAVLRHFRRAEVASVFKQSALSPVHTSNNVEATFDIVAFDNVASTLSLVWTGLFTSHFDIEKLPTRSS